MDCGAVTEMKDVFAFSWEVKHFRQLLRDTDPKTTLRSPTFTDANKREWQLGILWNEEEKKWYKQSGTRHLSLYLYLVKGRNSSKFSIQFDVLDANKSSRMSLMTWEHLFPANGSGWGYPQLVKIEDLLDEKKKLLVDDTLRLRCNIKMRETEVYGASAPEAESGGKLHNEQNNFISDFSNLFNSSNFSDVSIQTKSSMLKAHKAVLSCRSPVFSAMLLSGMSEATNNCVDIMDFDDEVVKEMLKYIYCGKVSPESLKEKCVDLFLIAEKYDIKGLKEETNEVIEANLSVENVSDSLILADMNCSLSLRSRAIKFINMNKEAVIKTQGFQKIWSYSPDLVKELYQSP